MCNSEMHIPYVTENKPICSLKEDNLDSSSYSIQPQISGLENYK